MSVIDKFKKHEAAVDAPETHQAPLRSVLIDKLREKAEQGDIAAIKLLLDSPELLNTQVPPTLAEAKASLANLLRDLSERRTSAEREQEQQALEREANTYEAEAMRRDKQRTDFIEQRFEAAVEARLKMQNCQLELRGWAAMTADQRQELWSELRDGLRSLGELLEANRVQTVQ